jgi:transposase
MMEVMYPKSSGLDVHLKFVIACVFSQNKKGETKASKRRFGTTTNELSQLVSWLQEHGVEQVAMESTGVYWKPVYNLLHPHFDIWVVNAQHLSRVPGRKTDESDAEWLTRLMQYGLLNRSFIPDEWQRDLRDLTRYRTRLIQEKSSGVNRLHKILQDANIKLSSVVTDIQGVSARSMIEALIEDEMEVEQMAHLARGTMRPKIPRLVEALTGFVRPHHRFMLTEILQHLDHLKGRIGALDRQIASLSAPYASLIERLSEIVGVKQRTSEIILAEVGPCVKQWPTSGHLASWACLCPGNHESGGKRYRGTRRKGQKWLVPALVEAAHAASRTKDTYLAAQFHRLRTRRGVKRAAVAVAHSILTIVYHLIQKPEARFTELGGDFFLLKNKEQEQDRAVRKLEALGFHVALSSAPA